MIATLQPERTDETLALLLECAVGDAWYYPGMVPGLPEGDALLVCTGKEDSTVDFDVSLFDIPFGSLKLTAYRGKISAIMEVEK